MAIVTLIRCDRCGTDADTEHLGPFDIDPDIGPRMLDLCPPCRDELITPALVALIDDYGARPHGPDAAPPPKPRPEGVACPVCGVILGNRATVILHLQSGQHAMTKAEATRAIPPPGPTVTCDIEGCGQLCSDGQGILQHRLRAHGIRP